MDDHTAQPALALPVALALALTGIRRWAARGMWRLVRIPNVTVAATWGGRGAGCGLTDAPFQVPSTVHLAPSACVAATSCAILTDTSSQGNAHRKLRHR